MTPLRLDAVQTVLCLGAHADDIEIGCGGAVLEMLARRAGLRIWWVVFSTPGVRLTEAQSSAVTHLASAAAANVITHRFRDGYFPYEAAAIKDAMQELAGQVQPDLVFTHRLEDSHQDHRLLAELTWQAFRDHVVLEYEIPKYEGDLGRPNFFVPLSEAACKRKISLLEESFPSQREKPWFGADTFWSLLRLRGVECRSPSGLAEAFTCRKLTVELG